MQIHVRHTRRFLGYFSLPKRLILWDRATTSYPKLVIRKRIPKMMYYFCIPGICVMFASCNFALCNIYHVNLAGNQWSTFLSLLMVLLWRMYQPSLRKSSHLPWQWHPMETVSSVLVTSHLYVMCLIALFSNWVPLDVQFSTYQLTRRCVASSARNE